MLIFFCVTGRRLRFILNVLMTWNNILPTILSRETLYQENHKNNAKHNESTIFDDIILFGSRIIGTGLLWKLSTLHAWRGSTIVVFQILISRGLFLFGFIHDSLRTHFDRLRTRLIVVLSPHGFHLYM